jgi:hypothetical protein
MAQDKKSFVLYSDSQGLINQLPDDVAGRLLKHIYSYVNDENPTTDELLLNIAFEPIKMQLKRDLIKYEKKREQWSEAGKKSAEQRASTKANEKQRTLTNVDSVATVSTVNDNVNVNVNVISKDINIPTWDLFLAYGKEKEPSVKISALKNKYDAWVVNGWRNGNDKPIKNWKSALLQTLAYIEKETIVNKHIPLRI